MSLGPGGGGGSSGKAFGAPAAISACAPAPAAPAAAAAPAGGGGAVADSSSPLLSGPAERKRYARNHRRIVGQLRDRKAMPLLSRWSGSRL